MIILKTETTGLAVRCKLCSAYKTVVLRKYILPQKKYNFNFHIFFSWPWIMFTKQNAPGSNRQKLLRGALIIFGLKFIDLHSSPKKVTSGKLCFFWGRVYMYNVYMDFRNIHRTNASSLHYEPPLPPHTLLGPCFFPSVLHSRHFRIGFKAESSIISIFSFNFSEICSFHPPPLSLVY